jgi:hypothetical protein
MGTSHAASAPKRKSWDRVASAMRSPIRNASTITDAALNVAFDVIPKGFIGNPIAGGTNAGMKFLSSVEKSGFKETVEKDSIAVSEKFMPSRLSNSLWIKASSQVESKYINTPFGKIAEIAFKKSVSSVVTKGSKALEDIE